MWHNSTKYGVKGNIPFYYNFYFIILLCSILWLCALNATIMDMLLSYKKLIYSRARTQTHRSCSRFLVSHPHISSLLLSGYCCCCFCCCLANSFELSATSRSIPFRAHCFMATVLYCHHRWLASLVSSVSVPTYPDILEANATKPSDRMNEYQSWCYCYLLFHHFDVGE